MSYEINTYVIGRPSATLNRKIRKGSRIFLNGLLLQHGLDYELKKRNVKFSFPLEKNDILEVEYHTPVKGD